jgi:hypothetical protein
LQRRRLLPTSLPKENALENWHGTTILGVKKGGKTVIAGDGANQPAGIGIDRRERRAVREVPSTECRAARQQGGRSRGEGSSIK